MSSYFFCPRCRGLLTHKCTYLKHKDQCDANPANSECLLFACTKALYLKALMTEDESRSERNAMCETETETGSTLRRRQSKRLMNKAERGTVRVRMKHKDAEEEEDHMSVLDKDGSALTAKLAKSPKKRSSRKPRHHMAVSEPVFAEQEMHAPAEKISEVPAVRQTQDRCLTEGSIVENICKVQKSNADIVDDLPQELGAAELVQVCCTKKIKVEDPACTAAETDQTDAGDSEIGGAILDERPRVMKGKMEDAVKQESGSRQVKGKKSKPAIPAKDYMKLKKEKVLQHQKHSTKEGSLVIYKCPHCKFETKFVGFFDRHLDKCHNAEGQWVCSECCAVFSKRSTWKTHMNKHAKRFMCDKCSYRCSDARDLKHHVWKHTGEYILDTNSCIFIVQKWYCIQAEGRDTSYCKTLHIMFPRQ